MRHPILTIALLVTGLAAIPAAAQTDWLKQGKDLLGGATGKSGGASVAALSNSEIGAGLKEALRVGTQTVVGQLGKADGFNSDSAIHIPLPDSMKSVQSTLNRIGMSSMLDDLETRLNRAAEVATPKAKELFYNAIEAMTIDDVQGIYNGPTDAATQYFQKNMTPGLKDAFRPIVDNALAEAGAVQAYDNVMGSYKAVPFVPDVKADLTNHALDGAVAGIFHYVAQEEAAIRANPAARTTDLLKKAFSR